MKTKDGILEIEYINNVSAIVFDAADWSVVSLSEEETHNKLLANNLYNTPVVSHVALVLNRNQRKKRIQAQAGTQFFLDLWKYLETVSITYPKPNSGSNNGFLPIAETGYLFYKGDIPNTKNTAWFQEDSGHANATNLWDLSTQADEPENLYYQKFSWELQLLLKSMSGSLECRKFIYAVDTNCDELYGIYKFCKTYCLKCKLYITDNVEYRKMQTLIDTLA